MKKLKQNQSLKISNKFFDQIRTCNEIKFRFTDRFQKEKT